MKKRILIVDDQIGIRSLLGVLFYEVGFDIFEASNGIEALKMVDKHQPQIVVMDLRMPGMGGIETFNILKNKNKNIKVVLMSAFAEEEIGQYAIEKGAAGFFHKPFDLQDMKNFVLNITDESDSQTNYA